MTCRQCKNLVIEKKMFDCNYGGKWDLGGHWIATRVDDDKAENCKGYTQEEIDYMNLQEGECINPVTLDSYNIYEDNSRPKQDNDSQEMKKIKAYWERYEAECEIF